MEKNHRWKNEKRKAVTKRAYTSFSCMPRIKKKILPESTMDKIVHYIITNRQWNQIIELSWIRPSPIIYPNVNGNNLFSNIIVIGHGKAHTRTDTDILCDVIFFRFIFTVVLNARTYWKKRENVKKSSCAKLFTEIYYIDICWLMCWDNSNVPSQIHSRYICSVIRLHLG